MSSNQTQATLRIDTRYTIAPIDRRLFGGFLEHMGRAVYEGVYDPSSSLSDEHGFRRDVLDALRALDMSIIRYPGGNYVSFSDWRDGIGPRDRRPSRPDFAWRSIETNQFGIDEFMTWCSLLGAEPMMAVNLGTAGTREAAELLEYCNLSTDTYWANRRRQNGHDAPYGVRLWCLGNEMDGPWQAGHVPADVYAQRAGQAGIVMKGLDPTIETVVCGSSGRVMPTYMQWDRTVLEYCWDYADYISAHRYSENRRDDSAWFLAEGVEIDRVLDDYRALIGYVRAVKKSEKRVYVSFDEWNVWYKDMTMDGGWSQAPHLIEEVYNLEDAIVCAQYLTSFLRHADVVKVACLAQIANVIAPLLTRPDGLLRQTIYYPFAMIAPVARGVSVVPLADSPSYAAGERGDVPVLDAAVAFDKERGEVTAILVNRDRDAELDVDVFLAGHAVASVLGVEILGGDDVKAANTWNEPDRIRPRTGEAVAIDGGVRVRVPAPGLGVVRLRTASPA